MNEAVDPFELALRALRHRDRSRDDLDRRLAAAGVSGPERAETLDRLRELGYLDDARLGGARAAELAGRGWGDRKIRLDLEAQGLDREATEEALASLEPEPERARRLVEREGATAKVAGRLARNGFDPDSLASALGAVVASDTD